MNVYKLPREDSWREWDNRCIRGESGNVQRVTYLDIMRQTNQGIPVINYRDEHGLEVPLSPISHVDIMNTAVIAIYKKYGNQLFFTLCTILNNSIDKRTMKSILNPTLALDPTNLRKTYVAALRYHENNSDTVINLKITKFLSQNDLRMGQNEPPEGYLKRIRMEADFINSMAHTGEPLPITDRMLRSKFLGMAKQIDYLKAPVLSYDVGYIDVHGDSQQHSLDKYAKLLQDVYLERKDRATSGPKDSHGLSQRGFAGVEMDYDGDLELGLAMSESLNNTPRICYKYRDKGSCAFGDNCKFVHEKSRSTSNLNSKFPHKANLSNEEVLQFMENVQHESAMQLQDFKKKFIKKFRRPKDKMGPYKKKLDERNSLGSREKAAVAEEVKSEKAAAKEPEVQDEFSEDDESGSDLSALESDSEH
jgi:hypothetical protein